MSEEERFNGSTHLLGLVLAVAASAALIGRASELGVDYGQIAGCVIFAASMIVVYASSVLYHWTRGPLKKFWRKVDHCAIYVLIAGTYTPLATSPVGNEWKTIGGVAIWLIACVGISRELSSAHAAAPSLPLYLAMGWLGVIFAAPVVASLSPAGLAWLLAGAAFYTAGTVFYTKRWRYAHGIWHLFVVGGSACHFMTIFGLLPNMPA
jgi:hemolysin III